MSITSRPLPFAGKVAFLPFRVEEFFDEAGAHYVVSQVMQGFLAPGFGPGAEVTHWSGIPVARAIELNAARFAGSNAAAQHARGLDSLTVRPLVIHLPPDEEWVTVSYVSTDGVEHELRQKWLVTDNLPPYRGRPQRGQRRDALTALAAVTGEPAAALRAGSAGDQAMAAEEATMLAGLTQRGQQLALSLSIHMATRAASLPPTLDESVTGILPAPA